MPQARSLRALSRRVLWVVAFLVGLVVACSGSLAAGDAYAAQTASPPPASTGHHVVHDIHCEPFVGSDTLTGKRALHDLPQSADGASAGPERGGVCAASVDGLTNDAPVHGRALLISIGVDRT